MTALRMAWSASLIAARQEPLHITHRGERVGVVLTSVPPAYMRPEYAEWRTVSLDAARDQYSGLIKAVARGDIPGVVIFLAKQGNAPWVAIVPEASR